MEHKFINKPINLNRANELAIVVVTVTPTGDLHIQISNGAFLDEETVAKAIYKIVRPAHTEAYEKWERERWTKH